MHAQAEPRLATGEEDGAGLVLGERIRAVRFAEDVDPAGVCGGLGEHRSGDQVHVVAPTGAVVRRDDVAAQEGDLVGHLAGEAQQPGLVGEGQPVARLDLDDSGSLGVHLVDPGAEQRAELVVGCGPSRGHRAGDPAAVVCRAAHPGVELGAAVAGEDQMRVAVDEGGDDRATVEVVPPVGDWRVAGRAAHPEHRVVGAEDQGGVVQGSEGVLGVRMLGVHRGQLADAGDEGGRHRSTRSASNASRNSGATEPSRWCSPRSTTTWPPTTTVATSAAVAV